MRGSVLNLYDNALRFTFRSSNILLEFLVFLRQRGDSWSATGLRGRPKRLWPRPRVPSTFRRGPATMLKMNHRTQ